MSDDRRKFRNYLVTERQIHYGALFLAVAMGVHAVATVILYVMYSAWQADGGESSTVAMWILIAGMIVVYALVFGFAFVMGLVISHRIYGPFVNFEKHFEMVKKGDFSHRIVLRKYDDEKLKDLAESINEITDRLAKSR